MNDLGSVAVSPDFLESIRFRLLRQVMLEHHMAVEAGRTINEFVEALQMLCDQYPYPVSRTNSFSSIASRGFR